ncbi:hypothetical protein BU25DRAFT_493885 [Macroventuria anomochaeta]|uniref:Uncharacterized protein n=1 Tax=Macroventuria anomochaeta TaxID=301207 RepID=A0ACB6RQB8_9PLEO|nr:uncharacterized protein BU25DRAFT_493885 [Macroventuria anomochaeta]KAF2623974.1 hypothetical protein BU25DRAFT_493885 [Macroventuria anomochaeta]
MASTSATEIPTSNSAVEIKDGSPDTPPTKFSPLDTTVDTPPSSPVADMSSPSTAAAPDTVENITVVVVPEPVQPSASAVECDNGLEDGEIVGHSRSTSPEAEKNKEEVSRTEIIGDHTTTQQSLVSAEYMGLPKAMTESETGSEDGFSVSTADPDAPDAAAANNGICGTHLKKLAPAVDLSITTGGLSVTSEVDSSEEKDDQHDTKDYRQTNGVSEKDGTDGGSEDEAFGDDEDTAVESQRHDNIAPALPRRAPPHMRPMFKAPNAQYFGSQGRRRDWPAPILCAPRNYYPPVGYRPSRPPLDYDELQRTKAQLMKARNDLEVERKVNAEMRKRVGAEKQASIGAAMSDMLTALLQKQADTLAAKAKTQEKERDLQYRERKIAQLEDYLSDGQRQLKYQLEQQGIRSMSVVDRANLRREVELKVRHQFSDIEGKIAIQVERLCHQEAAQKIHERQYKALIHDAVENEIREQLARDVQVKIADAKVAEAAYKRGVAEGKKVRGAEASEATLKQEFLKGYAACYRSQTTLYNVRNGHIAADSPELVFLYDPTQVENTHNLGLSIGRMEVAAEKVEKSTVGVLVSLKSMEEGAARAAAITGEPRTASSAATYRVRCQAQFNDAGPPRSSQAAERQQERPTQTQKMQQEEPTRSSVPPCATFAGELRGSSSSATPNGIFASRFNPQSTPNAPRTTATPITNSVSRVGTVGHVSESVYAGRRPIRYEDDSDVEPASPNLIDLY